MWSKLHYFLWIFFYFLIINIDAVPVESPPRFNLLGHRPQAIRNLTNEVISTTSTPAPSQPEPANFEYALLGQDPKDQHWYRVSLTPKGGGNKPGSGGYRAEFATRKLPPYNDQLAHKHDKTISDLLNWLEQSEERNLLKVYRDLLINEAKDKQAYAKTNEIPTEERPKHENVNNQSLLLLGNIEEKQQQEEEEVEERTTPKNINSTENDPKMVKNFVYFIKGLE